MNAHRGHHHSPFLLHPSQPKKSSLSSGSMLLPRPGLKPAKGPMMGSQGGPWQAEMHPNPAAAGQQLVIPRARVSRGSGYGGYHSDDDFASPSEVRRESTQIP